MEKLKNIFIEYKKSIDWVTFWTICLVMNFALLLSNWTLFNFFLLNCLLFVITIFSYIAWKYKLPL